MPTYTVPTEIALDILNYIRPYPTSIAARFSDTLQTDGDLLPYLVIKYYSELAEFTQLRLVSVTWSLIVGKMIYEHLILVSYPLQIQRRYHRFLSESNAWIGLVRTITICDLANYAIDPKVAKESEVFIDKMVRIVDLISNITSTQLQKLEVMGQTSAFRTRSWMAACSPNLPTGLTKLYMAYCEHKSVSNALVGLGKGLEELELVASEHGLHPIQPTFHLPKEFPNLKTLALSSCSISLQDHKKLFSRIGSLTHCPIRKKRIHLSNLRECRLIDSSVLSPQEVTGLLRINGIGKALTVLHLQLCWDMWGDPEDVIEIAKECQALVDFQFDGAIQKALYPALSPHLKRLSLAVWPRGTEKLAFFQWDEDGPTPMPILDAERMCYFQLDKILEAIDPSTTKYRLDELVVMIHAADVDLETFEILDWVRVVVDIDQHIVDAMAASGVALKSQMFPRWPRPLDPPKLYVRKFEAIVLPA